MKVAVISDTHFPGRGLRLPEACQAAVRSADLVIHGGDLCDLPTLRMLRSIGPPLVAVHGNADDDEVRRILPATATVDVGDGVALGVVHNGGAEAGRLERLRRRFPGCAGVVFGHSHIPLLATARDGFFILNPGSVTDRRRQPRHSMAVVEFGARRPAVRFIAVDEPPGPLPDDLVRQVG